MKFEEKRFSRLFTESSSHYYLIPRYQRAYEWDTNEKKKRNQVKEFWEDLKEFIGSKFDFPLGNIIILKTGDKHEIVDGQQRITTVIILIKSIIDRLRKLRYVSLCQELTRKYLIFEEQDYKNIKFRPQEYDINFWEDYVVKGIPRNPETPSQKRIKEAKEFFDRKLDDLDFILLNKIKEKLENAILGVIEISNKKEATTLFELQNDRGKPLTNLEKAKAFFMHQTLICNGSNEDIEYIYREFQEIYRIINSSFPLNEDEVFLYHIQAHTDLSYDYRDISELKNLIKNKTQSERIAFIKNFSHELSQSFKVLKYFFEDRQKVACYLKDSTRFKFAFVYPFIIKLYKLFKDEELTKALMYLEKIIFVHNITYTRADIRSRLKGFLKDLGKNTNINDFFIKLFKKLTEERYWRDTTIIQVLNGYMYDSFSRYILKRYEIHLREKEQSYNGYVDDLVCNMSIYSGDENKKTGWWIEHVAPRTENMSEDNGYEKYDTDFIDNYLNSIGNLLLVTQNHNICLGNEKFSTKLESYKNSPMFHHREIEKFVKNNMWTKESIEERKNKIIDFVIKTWGLDYALKNINKTG